MSKYIIEIDDDLSFDVQFLQAIGAEPNGVVRIRHIEFEKLEELNSDYINEHFGELQETAYQRGLEEGKKATWELVADASNAEYQKGLNDAWECARKIADMWTRIDNDELLAIFGITERIGHSAIKSLFGKQTANEAMLELKAYEEKQNAENEIKVGDEVDWSGDKFIVTRIFQPYDKAEECDGVDMDGCTYNDVLISVLTKTGRHVDITDMLKGALE